MAAQDGGRIIQLPRGREAVLNACQSPAGLPLSTAACSALNTSQGGLGDEESYNEALRNTESCNKDISVPKSRRLLCAALFSPGRYFRRPVQPRDPADADACGLGPVLGWLGQT
jgi:hypothetical protein